MSDKKLQKVAEKGAKKTASLVDDWTEKLDKYRIDDWASEAIDDILAKLKTLADYEATFARKLKDKRKAADTDQT